MADTELAGLFTNAITNGLSHGDIKQAANLHKKKSLRIKNVQAPRNIGVTLLVICIVVVLVALQIPKPLRTTPMLYLKSRFVNRVFDPKGKCLVVNSDYTVEITRKPAKCDICKGITQVCSVILFFSLFNDVIFNVSCLIRKVCFFFAFLTHHKYNIAFLQYTIYS
jgi:hypothetical protein